MRFVMIYPSSIRAELGAVLAWASMAVEAWAKILYLAKFVDSAATSTSIILLFADCRLALLNLR